MDARSCTRTSAKTSVRSREMSMRWKPSAGGSTIDGCEASQMKSIMDARMLWIKAASLPPLDRISSSCVHGVRGRMRA